MKTCSIEFNPGPVQLIDRATPIVVVQYDPDASVGLEAEWQGNLTAGACREGHRQRAKPNLPRAGLPERGCRLTQEQGGLPLGGGSGAGGFPARP